MSFRLLRNLVTIVALLWVPVSAGIAAKTYPVWHNPALQPTATGRQYWEGVFTTNSKEICEVEDLADQGETMDECVAGWDQALANLKQIPANQRNYVRHQATIKLGDGYYIDAFDAYKPDGTFVLSVALLIMDGKVMQSL